MLRRRAVQAGRALQQLGVDPLRLRGSLRGIPTYVRNRRAFLKQAAEDSDRLFALGDEYPVLVDRYDNGGVANGHYFHQDLLVAQLIHRAEPTRHVDVGSRVDGFVAHVAAFRQVDVLDIRPLRTSAARITFVRRDITLSDPTWDDATDSLSCLHTLEHVGLGRYGDRVDYYGYLDAWNNLTRMLRPGGILYFSVPIGAVQRIEFDAHRIFSVPYLIKALFEPSFDVESFAYVDDRGELHTSADVASGAAARSFDLSYGCGVFALRRR